MVILLKKHRRLSLTTRYVVVVGVLLLVANIILGLVSINQSKNALRTMIRKNMLDISNTAAELLDGDVMGAMTEEDVGSPAWQDALNKLSAFQRNADIEFIYAVRQLGEDSYGFLVDADPVEPGAFGEEIVVTNAVIQAGKGVATVDDSPAEDRWGNFYSAYSPVFDSEGSVAAIVGVDFSAEWYERELYKHSISVGVISVVSVIIGAAVMALITGKVRGEFKTLDREMSELVKNVDELAEEISANSGTQDAAESDSISKHIEDSVIADEIDALGVKIQAMQREMARYLDFMHAQAYTDSLTHVKNTNAYIEEIKTLNEQIADGHAEFCAAVFDIDNLKIVNDRYGHVCGDQIIKGAAEAISSVFGAERCYRIGGDEFIAIHRGMTESECVACLEMIGEACEAFNRAPGHPKAALSISMGAAAFRPGVDTSFREVFMRADEAMYQLKGEHHRQTSARHQRSEELMG